MQMNEQYLKSTDGHEIYVRTYMPNTSIIGHIHILHGMAEHCRRYHAFANFLCQHGYVVTMHDHRGHGLTAERNGMLGFIAENNGFDVLVNDALTVILATRANPNWPLPIILGHSMGSFVARRLIQQHNSLIKGVILSGTAVTSPFHHFGKYIAELMATTIGKQTPSSFLNKLSFGSFNKSFPNATTAFDWLCSDGAEVQKYMEDPYCGFVASTQFFVDLTTGLTQINKNAELVQMRRELPVLFLSGADDPVANFGKGPLKVAKKFAAIGMKDVTVHVFEHMRHEILNEKQHQLVYDVILRWLKKHE